MNGEREARRLRQELLTRLRSERGPLVESASQRNRIRRSARKKIKAELAKGPITVPAAAEATALPTSEVLWHFAAMRKYGELEEYERSGEYFTYRLVAGADEGDAEEGTDE